MASDSNLTRKDGNAGFGQKIFPIPYLNAALAYSGLYEINSRNVDDWMNEFIINESFITSTIEEFVINLTGQLNLYYRGTYEDNAIIHICGYAFIDYNYHLEHWHISNSNLQPDGGYIPTERFEFHNDFNTRTRENDRKIIKMFDVHPDNHQFFINGFPPARMSFMVIKKTLGNSLNQISAQQSWSFRPPKNIFESSAKLKMYFYLIGEMFKMSDYEALFVGGETQTYLIPAPNNILKD